MTSRTMLHSDDDKNAEVHRYSLAYDCPVCDRHSAGLHLSVCAAIRHILCHISTSLQTSEWLLSAHASTGWVECCQLLYIWLLCVTSVLEWCLMNNTVHSQCKTAPLSNAYIGPALQQLKRHQPYISPYRHRRICIEGFRLVSTSAA